MPVDIAAVKRAQVGFGQRRCLPHRRFARIAVKVSGHDQAGLRQRQTGGHHRPGAAGQHPARRIPHPAQTDAVGVSQRRKLAQ